MDNVAIQCVQRFTREKLPYDDKGNYLIIQIEAGNAREGLREVELDVAEGADIVMVKPAGTSLDVLAAAAAISPVPVWAYQVSGEYSMIEAAAANGWIDRDRAILESLTVIKRAGADAILLIAAILNDAELDRYLATAHSLGMDCLVEVHTLGELERVKQTDAETVGINNRDLTTFTTDIARTFDLLPHCDPRWRIISESGIHDTADARRLQKAGVKGALVGESLVRAPDIAALTRALAQPEMMNGRNQHA